MPDIVEQLNEACDGHPSATIPWPHRLLHNAADEIKRLRDRYEGQPAAEGQENVWPLYGYAPGMYQFKCGQCGEMKMGDKRSTICLECAVRRLRLSLSEARATGRREGMEAMTDALNDDALTKRAADFLLERDQQTTQDERDEGEREASAFIILQMGAAAIRAAMEKEE